MKLKPKIQKILEKYKLDVKIPQKYHNVYDYLRDEKISDDIKEKYYHKEKNDMYFINKYDKYISEGFYGFAIGSPTPVEWLDALDEILEILIENDPNFKIQQVKMKFGGIRFYVTSEIIDDLWDIELLIESKLYSKDLMY